MERISVAVSTAEGIERREFTSGSKAGAEEKIVRERYGLRNGSLSQDRLTFTEDETLLAGNYVFDGFTREGKCYLVLFLSLNDFNVDVYVNLPCLPSPDSQY